MMGFGGIFGILLIILLTWAVIQFVGKGGSGNLFRNNQQTQAGQDEDALEILKKRYVRGEISKEEYEKIKREIS